MNIYIINLPKDKQRCKFQEEQFKKLNLKYKIINATSTKDIKDIYSKHYLDWQRPLREVEVACYYSHQKLWKEILLSNKPALILEDDVIICNKLPKILNYCKNLQNIDYINLETVGRKKLLSKEYIEVDNNFKLQRLYIDRNGTGAYILYPSGAKKLLDIESKSGIALADAQIKGAFNLISYQLNPACIIQSDQASKYNIKSPIKVESNIGMVKKPKIPSNMFFHFKFKRIKHQIKLLLRELKYLFKAKKEKVEIYK